MIETPKPILRCAVYTRKSNADGLEQDYNSIDSQRDAGHAYIASMRAEGWTAVNDDYDDPAYSGGNMERPALQRLLRDIEQGKIDIVVVYKIDRLTRSLTDFSKMIDVFDSHKVSFASVTQQINSASSMGRLMLNVLLSFAQFEREITGERIRDKITASKKKGLWMGSIPSLGYDVKDKRLVINKEEAKSVNYIFRRFIELDGSTSQMVKELQQKNITSKPWLSKQGKHKPGKVLDKSGLYKILHNRTYLGELRHKEQWYTNTHKAIIEKPLWDEAHEVLKHNHHTRGNHLRSKIPFLLKGIVFAKDGRAMTTTTTNKKKNGRRYRYYMHTLMNKQYAAASSMPRIPAAELESAVVKQLHDILKSPTVIQQTAIASKAFDDSIDEAQATVAMLHVGKVWSQLFPDEQSRIVKMLVDKIIVDSDNIELHLRNNGIQELAHEFTPVKKLTLEARSQHA